MPNQDRILDREFALSGIDSEHGSVVQYDIQQLVTAVGVRPVPEPGGLGLALLAGVTALARRRRRRRAE